MHWSSPKGWCDRVCTDRWIPRSSELLGCGWAPEPAVEQCTTVLLSYSDKKLLLLLDDMLNSVWFTYMYMQKNRHVYSPYTPVFLWFVSFIPYVSHRLSAIGWGGVCHILTYFFPLTCIKTFSKVSSWRLEYLIRGIKGYDSRAIRVYLKPLHSQWFHHLKEE